MVYSTCLHDVLKTLPWKPVTQHFKQTYLKICVVDGLRVCINGGKYALVNESTNEWTVVPLFIANTLTGGNGTVERGPFIFKNGFDQTREAAYLLEMLQYTQLTQRSQIKVDSIKRHYSDWISYDDEVRDYLRRHIKWL